MSATTPGERLSEALRKEADRRSAMGDYAMAHNLRKQASAVITAESYLIHSQAVK